MPPSWVQRNPQPRTIIGAAQLANPSDWHWRSTPFYATFPNPFDRPSDMESSANRYLARWLAATCREMAAVRGRGWNGIFPLGRRGHGGVYRSLWASGPWLLFIAAINGWENRLLSYHSRYMCWRDRKSYHNCTESIPLRVKANQPLVWRSRYCATQAACPVDHFTGCSAMDGSGD